MKSNFYTLLIIDCGVQYHRYCAVKCNTKCLGKNTNRSRRASDSSGNSNSSSYLYPHLNICYPPKGLYKFDLDSASFLIKFLFGTHQYFFICLHCSNSMLWLYIYAYRVMKIWRYPDFKPYMILGEYFFKFYTISLLIFSMI